MKRFKSFAFSILVALLATTFAFSNVVKADQTIQLPEPKIVEEFLHVEVPLTQEWPQFSKFLPAGETVSTVYTGIIIDQPITQARAFDVIADNTKDYLFYPGVEQAVLIKGNGGVGSVYEETANFGGGTFEQFFTVTKYDYPNVFQIRGQSPILDYIATYKFETLPDGKVKYTSYNTIVSFGIPAQAFKGFLLVAVPKILDYLGTTGTTF